MSIVEITERYMKRYDYLMKKRERKYTQGKRLTPEEDEELQKIRPNVVTPIFVMFELLHDIVKKNQEIRRSSGGRTGLAQLGGGSPDGTPPEPSAPPLEDDDDEAAPATAPDDAAAKEEARLLELEESLLPLLTKIIIFIEQNKKAEKKKDEIDEDEKYPDIGTSAKNSAILVIRRIKKWWNDLIQGGTSDLSSSINLKKAIPQLSDNNIDMNKLNDMADKVITAVDDPLKKIAKVLSNDVRDIASSSVEGIMNALSLIPGIGTTLQLWRLLQNVIVIMSKSVTTMAGAKTQGVAAKTNIMGLQGEIESMATNAAQGAAEDAAQNAAASAMDSVGIKPPAGMPALTPSAMTPSALTPSALPAMTPPALPAVTPPKLGQGGGGGGASDSGDKKFNHLRSIKKYKREYKQSLREIRKTRKRVMKYIRNII